MTTPPVRRQRGSLRRLLRPEWFVLVAVVVAFSYLAFTVLAPWQLGKNSRTQERNHQLEWAASAERVPVGDLVGDGTGTIGAEGDWLPVTAMGRFLAAPPLVVTNRTINEFPAMLLLAPVEITSGPAKGSVVLVNRGWRNTNDPAAVTPPPGGEVELAARLRVPEQPADDRTPVRLTGDAVQHVADSQVAGEASTALREEPLALPYLSPQQVAQTVQAAPSAGGSVAQSPLRQLRSGWYLELTDESPGALAAMPLPAMETGPYLSYGLQWLLFGTLAPLGLVYFFWRRLRDRRDADEEEALLAEVEEEASSVPAELPSTPETPETPAESTQSAQSGTAEVQVTKTGRAAPGTEGSSSVDTPSSVEGSSPGGTGDAETISELRRRYGSRSPTARRPGTEGFIGRRRR